eukprot:scaffold3282_cov198-Alexandrium_tamarense.AAC.39
MGGCNSKASHLENVDDSVHVMLAHDRKKRKETGAPSSGYKPRAANPVLEQKREEIAGDANGAGS